MFEGYLEMLRGLVAAQLASAHANREADKAAHADYVVMDKKREAFEQARDESAHADSVASTAAQNRVGAALERIAAAMETKS